jgi:hypothetical protein
LRLYDKYSELKCLISVAFLWSKICSFHWIGERLNTNWLNTKIANFFQPPKMVVIKLPKNNKISQKLWKNRKECHEKKHLLLNHQYLVFDLSNGKDIFNIKRIFLISWHLYLLQINKALNFEVFILLQKTLVNRHPKLNWSKRRYHNTKFEPQAICIKRIEHKKGGGNTTVFFIFYFITTVYSIPKSTQFYVEKSENSTIDITTHVCALD